MKLLFDQNISPKILKVLPVSFEGCQHIRFVQLEDAADLAIFKYAERNDYAVVTFDSDFIDLNALYGTPPKIIYLNTGNLTTKSVAQLFKDNALKILHYLESNTDEILELIK